MTKVYVFAQSLARGKRAERILDKHYLRKGYEVESASLEVEKRDKIDRILIHRLTGESLKAEYKLDSRCIDTGNVFIELYDHKGRPSWGFVGKSDIIVILMEGWDVALEIPGDILRRAAVAWGFELSHKTVVSEGGYGDISVVGVAVPVEQVYPLATNRIFIPTDVGVN
jgi:hypothetical protein